MMGLQEVVSWYQKKIGTYDKQQWERTVEQRILHGLTHVPKKTAKLKTELIDVDLVRGSSFPKAKPKHGLLTVARLSLARLLFLPVYRQWWVQQTSVRVFALLLVLYCLQLLNMILFTWCSWHMPEEMLEHVSASEVLVPTAMMMVLSFLHSQIVAPHAAPSRQDMPTAKTRSRVKRVKRRVLVSARSRTIGSDSKSSPDTGSDKTSSVKESLHSKFNKRVRMHRGSDDKRSRGVAWEESDSALASPNAEAASPESPPETVPGQAASGSAAPRQRVRLQVADQPADEDNLRVRETTPLDDDGFESLNGNGSSENGEDVRDEDNGNPKPSSSGVAEIKDQVSLPTPSLSEEQLVSVVTYTTSTTVGPEAEGAAKDEEEGGMSSLQSLPASDAGAGAPLGDRDRWVQEILTSRHTTADSETDGSAEDVHVPQPQRERTTVRRRGSKATAPEKPHESSYNSSCESEDVETVSSPGTGGSCPLLTEGTTSAAEWIGVTTNSEECSYSSEPDESDSQREFTGSNSVELNDHPFAWEFELSPTIILNPSCAASDKVSCTIWEKRDPKKADLSVLDISSAIIARVETMPENVDYFYGGAVMALLLALLPSLCRFIWASSDSAEYSVKATKVEEIVLVSSWQLITFATTHVSEYLSYFAQSALGNSGWERSIVLIAMFERGMLAALFFFLLAVAERTFKQRFLYAKLFSHLTSFRRARKSDLPHFRLNKVRNIKTWLSVRSYLKRRGPQRSVDVIVSAAFLITLLLLSFLSVECLKDAVRLHSEYNLEALVWCLALGFFLLRFMTLGTKINRKYRNLSVLITEQINLYLQIEQKPNKKEELMVANSVLKLAADLLKELESPFKISGLSANPYLYTITKVVILSALSGVLSEMLGFKLKLHKIKINHS